MVKKYYRVPEAAQFLGISVSCAWLYIKQSKLSSVKLSPRVTVISVDELNAFVNTASTGDRDGK
jgi:predicted DNA-binding transcriptional regulator AlpA